MGLSDAETLALKATICAKRAGTLTPRETLILAGVALDGLAVDAASVDPEGARLAREACEAVIAASRHFTALLPARQTRPGGTSGTCTSCAFVYPMTLKGLVHAHGVGPKGKRRACLGQDARSVEDVLRASLRARAHKAVCAWLATSMRGGACGEHGMDACPTCAPCSC